MYQGKWTQPANTMSSETTLEKGQMVKILWADITNGDKNTKLLSFLYLCEAKQQIQGTEYGLPTFNLSLVVAHSQRLRSQQQADEDMALCCKDLHCWIGGRDFGTVLCVPTSASPRQFSGMAQGAFEMGGLHTAVLFWEVRRN